MNRDDLNALAQHLIASASDALDYSNFFKATYDVPPTVMAKVHHMRSVLQARLLKDAGYELSERWAEFGRLEVNDIDRSGRLLLKSANAFAIEQQMEVAGQFALFPAEMPNQVPDLFVIIMDFQRDDLVLSSVPAVEVGRPRKVRVIGQPVEVGRWPLVDLDFASATAFDQNTRDRFDELGAENDAGGQAL